ncbi:hypothetical protein QQF64_001429 [Cirrhinus molitorella]|uniref:Uncharacterized protein n=1 Tax=Cirrhinus molitorella TaxID=172907 RepID=A0ABR3P099_9TELE
MQTCLGCLYLATKEESRKHEKSKSMQQKEARSNRTRSPGTASSHISQLHYRGNEELLCAGNRKRLGQIGRGLEAKNQGQRCRHKNYQRFSTTDSATITEARGKIVILLGEDLSQDWHPFPYFLSH